MNYKQGSQENDVCILESSGWTNEHEHLFTIYYYNIIYVSRSMNELFYAKGAWFMIDGYY